MKNNGTFGTIDSLTISYDGNRLLKVTDDAEALNYNGALDFNDGANADCEYQYDSNGALTCDSNRSINCITYDYEHHPSEISMMSKKMTLYNDYTPDGRKLSSRHYGMVPKGNGSYRRLNTTDLYIDGLILRDGVPFMWQFDGGYVSLNANATPTSWNYYVTDHLGSTRKVVDSNNNVKETINYYPFGSEMRMQDPAQMAGDSWQSYRFTGKELDKQNGLNWYDFGARWFDVAGVPMWTSVDPLAEKYYPYTPYSYCAGDPVNNIDIKGDSISVLIAPDGANGCGHMAVLIQNKENKWEYYSKNGTEDFFGLYGEPNNDNKGEFSFQSVDEFLNSSDFNPIDKETNQRKYTEAYLIPSTSTEDIAAVNGAMSQLGKKYNVLGSNCAATVQSALSAAGKDPGTPEGISFSPYSSNAVLIADYLIRSKMPNHIYQQIKSKNRGEVIKPRR